ncbi:hypothetical protein [Nucisporomicrobium flavum]|uniref:hypothetical protein n=1 Tax=Nucisporomicrobium flavum TaxID=2785915 RepID=UPI0018F3D26D|nr:hypothetical protein [Nucisporomicrobium flavum]
MTADDDRGIERLGALDPVLRDAPPAPGSARYRAILEKAMTQTTTPIRAAETPAAPRRGKRRALFAAMATGVAAAAVAVTVAVTGNSQPSVSPTTSLPSILLAAAEKTQNVTSLKFSEAVHGGGAFSAEGEVNGDDYRIVTKGEGTSETIIVVGNQQYTTPAGGKTTRTKLSADEKMVPFTKAAGDVVRAAVSDGNVQKIGTESVRGVEATHYRLTIAERTSDADPAAALTKLPDTELGWFGLDGVAGYSSQVTVDIWVADNLVRRIGGTIQGQDPLATIDFYDFNKPVTIKAP